MNKKRDYTPEQEQIIEKYCENDLRLLRKICDPIIQMKNIPQFQHDDLYENAMWVLEESVMSYQKSRDCSFHTFLVGNIKRSFYDWTRDNRRWKRCNLETDENGKLKRDENGNTIIIPHVSLDATTDEGIDLFERVASDFNIENELTGTNGYGYSENVESFLNQLSGTQRKIAEMVMYGCSATEIKEKLELTDKQYQSCWKTICSYENKRILYKRNNNMEDDEVNTTVLTEDVAESYKNTSYSIDSISKQLQKKRIRDDHILQRHSGQWKNFAKSELISDILRGKSLTQIIISEEIKNGLRMQWLIDGKQRCTTLDDYLHDGFAISKNVKNYNIRYQTTKTDENGYEVLNEDGFTEMEFKEFDIRGKKFSQLPEELQDIFRDRQIPVLYNMNCTKKDIADDIARFNRSRPMNIAQNGWLGLDESFAELVDNITKMQFFQTDFTGSAYTDSNKTSGMLRRVVVEGIMASDFIDNFSKDFEKMCEFLSDEASDANFTEFYSFIDRLTVVSNQEVAKMFNSTDSFLWFGLFSRFSKLGIDDSRFIDFMIEFNNSLKNKKIDGESYTDLSINKETGRNKGTKDKMLVLKKMNYLEVLMNEYLHIEEVNPLSDVEFISQNVEIPIADVEQDIQLYMDTLDELEENCIRVGSKLLDKENRQSMLSIVAYAYKNDIDLDKWMETYAATNNTYFADAKKSFLHMVDDLTRYNQRMAVAS